MSLIIDNIVRSSHKSSAHSKKLANDRTSRLLCSVRRVCNTSESSCQGRFSTVCCASVDHTDHSLEGLLDSLRQNASGSHSPGEVYLVGTGPGDPGLLTLKAVQIMQSADVVLYDRLISTEILEMVNKNAVMVYVGKNRGFHTRTQTEIHELLCQFASQGARVVRLKGGDPFVFGRGGEEMEYLQTRGICVHTIPGITAGSGISAELGIPLTHRGLATGCAFITGHAREGGEDMLDDSISAAADEKTTLVVYMGLNTLPALLERLQAAGLSGTTPTAAIERGTTPKQRGVYAKLEELKQEVELHHLQSPTLVIIGQVVSLSPGWRMAMQTGCSLQDGRTVSITERNSMSITERNSMEHLSASNLQSSVMQVREK